MPLNTDTALPTAVHDAKVSSTCADPRSLPLAGVQSAKARLQSLVNSPEQASYHNSPPPFEPRSAGSPHPSQHKRDTSVSRGRIPILPANGSSNLHAQIQLPGRAVSPRVSPSNGEQSTRGGGLERRPSANYGHHRQTSIVHGLPQHSRNSSLAKSPALSHRSPQLPTSSHTPNGFLNDTLGFSPLFTSSPDFQPFMSPLSTGSSVLSTPSSITAGARETTRDGNGSEATFSTQRKMDRKPSGKVKREHGNSHTKHQAEQVTVGECALQHLFHMVSRRALSCSNASHCCCSSSIKQTSRSLNVSRMSLTRNLASRTSAVLELTFNSTN